MTKTKSPRFDIDKIGLKKCGKGFVIALGGLVLTYLEQALPFVNFGEYTPIAYAVNSAVVNFGRKFLSNF